MEELHHYSKVARDVAIEAGELIRFALSRPKNVEHKGPIDLVTETDKASEATVLSRLRAAFPEHKFIAEESSNGVYDLTDEPTWIVDPIDGTTNFVHGWPECCVCIGLTLNKEPVVGVVYNPTHRDLFYAIKGLGAFWNDRSIAVSDNKDLSTAIVMSEFGYNRTPHGITQMVTPMTEMMRRGLQAVRMSGSGALDLCYIARGIAEGIYAWGWKPWDYAAASLILREAGGALFDPSGGEFSIMGAGIVAGNKHIAPIVLQVLRDTGAV